MRTFTFFFFFIFNLKEKNSKNLSNSEQKKVRYLLYLSICDLGVLISLLYKTQTEKHIFIWN